MVRNVIGIDPEVEATLPLDDDTLRGDVVHDSPIAGSQAGCLIVGVEHDRRANRHPRAEPRGEVPCSHGVHTGIMLRTRT